MQETQVPSPGWKDPLEKEVATHSSTLAWEILCTEEPGGLQSMGLQKSRTQLNHRAHTHTSELLLFSIIICQPPSFFITFMGTSSTLFIFFFLLPHHAACGMSVPWRDQTHDPWTGSTVFTAEPQGKSLLEFWGFFFLPFFFFWEIVLW